MNIKAIFPPGVSRLSVNGLHQWDYGRKLEIQSDDLPALVEVHFACAGMKDAVVRSCAVHNGVAEAAIPDKCLEQTTPIIAWVYEVGETSGATVKTVVLPITERTQPQPGATIPEDVSNRYTELIAEVNELVSSLKEGNVTVAKALQADRATTATSADRATQADRATTAATATSADRAAAAGHANTADEATRATEDSDGNIISTYYAPKNKVGKVLYGAVTQQWAGTGYGNGIDVGKIPDGKVLDDVCGVGFSLKYTGDSVIEAYEMQFQGLRVVDGREYDSSEGRAYIKVRCICAPVSKRVISGSDQFISVTLGHMDVRLYYIPSGEIVRLVIEKKDVRNLETDVGDNVKMKFDDIAVSTCTLENLTVFFN